MVTKRESTLTEYAEIKQESKEQKKDSSEEANEALEDKEEDLTKQDEEITQCVSEGEGGEVEAVYSTVKDILEEV